MDADSLWVNVGPKYLLYETTLTLKKCRNSNQHTSVLFQGAQVHQQDSWMWWSASQCGARLESQVRRRRLGSFCKPHGMRLGQSSSPFPSTPMLAMKGPLNKLLAWPHPSPPPRWPIFRPSYKYKASKQQKFLVIDVSPPRSHVYKQWRREYEAQLFRTEQNSLLWRHCWILNGYEVRKYGLVENSWREWRCDKGWPAQKGAELLGCVVWYET